MSLYDDVRELQRIAGNSLARTAHPETPPIDGIFQTIADPNNNYPQPTNGGGIPNVYYAVRCSGGFDSESGQQGFSPSPMPGNQNNVYICNMGDAYIGLGTYVPCWQIGSQYFTDIRGPQVFFGTTGSVLLPGNPGYGTIPVTVSQIAGVAGFVPFTTSFTQQNPYPIPNGWPVIGIAKSGTIWHLKEFPLTQPAFTLNYIQPFGLGTATLLAPPPGFSSQVQTIDLIGNGAQPLDNQINVQYTTINSEVYDGQVPTAGWIILDSGCCITEGM